MTLIRWKPLRDITPWHPGDVLAEFDTFQCEVDRMIDRFRGGMADDGANSAFMPAVDIIEEKDDYIVKVDLPGLSKNDVKITVQNDILTIRGEKNQVKETEDINYRRMERSYGAFQRSFTLPSSVKNEKIDATFNDGVLTISLPKVEEAKPKEIEVKVK
ncbi:MAG TPA: Hsp20/alpha crystallin family protein [Bacteroidota bacterium]|nr:Hsp20/alpha crystallin family protein [Bacteroidota bacterium]